VTRVPSIFAELDIRRVQTRRQLADWLQVPDKNLRFLLYKLKETDRYRSFTIPKKNGGDRLISAPIDFLKKIQKKISLALDEIATPRQVAMAYIKGRGIVDHGGCQDFCVRGIP